MRVPVVVRKLAPGLLAVSLAVGSGSSALAQNDFYETERGTIYLGVFVTDRATDTRLDSDSGVGTDIDFEEDLGFDRSMSVARLGAGFYLQPRQRIDFGVFDLSRDATRRIDETIDFGDQTFTFDTLIESTYDLTITKVDYTFAPLSRPRGYLGLNAGLYIASTEVVLTAVGQNIQTTRESEDLTAPLPVFGFRGEYEVTDRITLGGAAQYFKIDIGDTSGSLRDIYIAADYGFGEDEKFAVGLAYNEVSMLIRAEEEDGFRGELDWGYDGWLVYFKTGFGSNANL
jgi:hypothetical protein